MSQLVSSILTLRELKDRYLEMVAKGASEAYALKELNLTQGNYLRLVLEDTEFAKEIEEARKQRAEVWVSEIARDVNVIHDKDAIAGQRLKFDKLVYLAKADNPDRYGGNKKSGDININLGQFKLLPPEEAMKSLSNDPFAIPAESITIIDTPDEELL